MSLDALTEAAYCHAVLAHYVEDPRLLASIENDETLSAFDVQRLHQMAGLITKVRHNPVRFRFPLTMRALALAGIEIDFFAHHAPRFSARRREGLTDGERASLFVTSLEEWLQPSDDGHRLVADVLAHEVLMQRVSEHAPVPPPDVDAAVGARSRPRLRDGVHLLRLTVHPPDVAGSGRAGAGPAAIDRTPRCYAYVPTPAGPRVKSIDPAFAALLEMADGSSTIVEIASAVGLPAAVDGFVAVFRVVIHRGLADVERP